MNHRTPFLFLLLFVALLFVACETTPPPPAGSFSGGEADTAVSTANNTAETASWTPRLNLNTSSGAPGATVTLVGTGFPPDQLVLIRLGTPDDLMSEMPVFAQATSDGLGVFELTLTLPTLWPLDATAVSSTQQTLLLRAETPAVGNSASPAEASFTIDYQDAFQTLQDDTAGFTLNLPATWQVSPAQITPLGNLRFFGTPPLEPGNPRVNLLLVADLEQLDALGAAEQLQCGGGCAADIALTAVEIGDTPAQQTVIGGDGLPALTWYFVEHAGRLLYFTYNDPATLTTLRPLVNSLTLGQAVALQPDPTPEPTAPPEPTATPEPEVVAETELESEPEEEAQAGVETTPATVTRDEGPLETTVNFLIDMTRQEVTPDTLDRLAAELRPEAETFTAVYALLELDDLFTDIDAARVNAPEVIVRAVLTSGGQTDVRLFTLLLDETDGAWRIVQIEVGDLDEPTEPEPTAEAENSEETSDG